MEAEGAEVVEIFVDRFGASVTGSSNEPFSFTGSCSIAAVADIESSCLEKSLTLVVGDLVELGDIAGRCAIADGVKGDVNFIRGDFVLLSVANGDDSRGIELCELATNGNGELRRLGFGAMVTGAVGELSSDRRSPSLVLGLRGELISGV